MGTSYSETRKSIVFLTSLIWSCVFCYIYKQKDGKGDRTFSNSKPKPNFQEVFIQNDF